MFLCVMTVNWYDISVWRVVKKISKRKKMKLISPLDSLWAKNACEYMTVFEQSASLNENCVKLFDVFLGVRRDRGGGGRGISVAVFCVYVDAVACVLCFRFRSVGRDSEYWFCLVGYFTHISSKSIFGDQFCRKYVRWVVRSTNTDPHPPPALNLVCFLLLWLCQTVPFG